MEALPLRLAMGRGPEHVTRGVRRCLLVHGECTTAQLRAAVQQRAPTIVELQAAGCESLRAIAAGLEERGIPAARGGKWSAVQVSRLLEAASPFGGSAAVAVA
jgi:Recombinase